MTSFDVTGVSALEILDSRGRPTLAVTVSLADGTEAKAGVPSGASTGSREAVELRDGDKSRYEGGGVLNAAGNVNGEIADLLRGRSWNSLADADQAMISLARKSGFVFTRHPEDWKLVRFEKSLGRAPREIPCASWRLAAESLVESRALTN